MMEGTRLCRRRGGSLFIPDGPAPCEQLGPCTALRGKSENGTGEGKKRLAPLTPHSLATLTLGAATAHLLTSPPTTHPSTMPRVLAGLALAALTLAGGANAQLAEMLGESVGRVGRGARDERRKNKMAGGARPPPVAEVGRQPRRRAPLTPPTPIHTHAQATWPPRR